LSKLLVIGLDAATFDLIDLWVAQGHLPNLAALLQAGTRSVLQSVHNLNSIPAWATFMTGKNPGKHGLFWFYERQPDSYAYRYLNGSDIHDKRFWDYMAQAGMNVGVVNVPMTYPAYPLNGFMLAGLDAPSESSPNFAYPPDLHAELLKHIGPYHIDTNILGYARSGRLDLAVQATRQVVEQRAQAIYYLMETKPWDVFVAVFTALDRVQHTFWRFMDAAHPAYDAQEAQVYGNVILDTYRLLDQVVGEMVRRAGAETPVLIVSDHGFGSNPESYSFLSPWLQSLGLFTPMQPRSSDRLVRQAAALADGLLPQAARRRIISLLPGGRAGLARRLHQVRCDWAKTQAYTNYIHAGLWVNLRGREPQGIVAPGQAYENLRQQLIDGLLALTDIQTGQKIVRTAQRREEVYHGPYLDRAPDVVMQWNYAVKPTGVQYVRHGKTIQVYAKTDIVERHNVSGDHRPEGVLIMRGPHIRAGEQLANASLVDIAPTLLYMAGLPVPSDMDGRVLTGAFERDYIQHRPVIQHNVATDAAEAERRDFSAEESALVEERLRNLGYLD
jgi:predicted AlkP superfamily phosphohydrolase/phosphomutase